MNITKEINKAEMIDKKTGAFIEKMTEISKSFFVSIEPKIKQAYKKLLESLKPFVEIIDDADQNPDSLLSWMDYCKIMEKCFWVFPYKLKPSELKHFSKSITTEEEFDKCIKKHFKKNIVISLSQDTIKMIPPRHKTIYKQIIKSYFEKSYQLCNLGLIAIIDDLTSFFIFNKKTTRRRGMFSPIIKKIKKLDIKKINSSHFVLMMLSKNIDMLYVNTDFNEGAKPNNKKGISRHSAMHGKYYSNKKESTLMLLNTVYYLLEVVKNFSQFKDKLEIDNKESCFKIIPPFPSLHN